MNITKIISKTFDSRLKQIDLYATQASEIQHSVLNRLVHQAAQTEWGKKYDYSSIRSYEDFRKRVPIQTYEEIKPYVERLRAGEQNLLWPSEIRWFAKSSGTTNDKSKFLPVSKEALQDIHYRGGKDAAALYFRINPDSHFFSGKGLILGGDVSNVLFSNGWIADEDGTVYIYYASSDTRMHVATSTIDRLIDYCFHTPADGLRSAASVENICNLIEANKAVTVETEQVYL